MTDLLAGLSASERALVSRADPPKQIQPMLATLTHKRFSDPDWIFERKFDGIRMLSVGAGGTVSLRSRNNHTLDAQFPDIVTALEERAVAEFVGDGEVVAFEDGRTSFARLARRGREHVPTFLYLFDVLFVDGWDVRRLPLLTRKRLLRKAVRFGDGIRLTEYKRREGEAFFREACRRRWEGLIAKRAESTYGASRSRDWLKFKCVNEQELVIGGYTAPHGSRIELGALLLGYFDSGRLRYAGKVGTGFDRVTLRDLAGRLGPLRVDRSPFAEDVRGAPGTTWVKPRLVAQIAFAEWTRDGRLRHPRFLGLRDDKPAREVVREIPS